MDEKNRQACRVLHGGRRTVVRDADDGGGADKWYFGTACTLHEELVRFVTKREGKTTNRRFWRLEGRPSSDMVRIPKLRYSGENTMRSEKRLLGNNERFIENLAPVGAY